MLKIKKHVLKEIGPEFCLDTLYADELYDTPFVIETKSGSCYTVSLCWLQGRGNNFRFVIGDPCDENAQYVRPSDVQWIEVRE